MIKHDYGCLYEEFDVEGIKKLTIFVFLGQRALAVIGLVSFSEYPLAQIGIYFALNLHTLIWDYLIKPHKSQFDFIVALSGDVVSIVVSAVYIKLCDNTLDAYDVEAYGSSVFYLILTLTTWNVVIMVIKYGYGIYEWYSNRSILVVTDISKSTPVEEIKKEEIPSTKNPNATPPN